MNPVLHALKPVCNNIKGPFKLKLTNYIYFRSLHCLPGFHGLGTRYDHFQVLEQLVDELQV